MSQAEPDVTPLRELFIEAVRYGERPDLKAKLDQVIARLRTDHLQQLVYDTLQVVSSTTISSVQGNIVCVTRG